MSSDPSDIAAAGLVLKPCSLHSCQKGKAKASWRIMGSGEAFLEPFWVRFINRLNAPWWSSPNPAEIFHPEIKFCCALEVREQVFRNHSLVGDYPGNINKFVILLQYKTAYWIYVRYYKSSTKQWQSQNALHFNRRGGKPCIHDDNSWNERDA